jgi:hypothetical protein
MRVNGKGHVPAILVPGKKPTKSIEYGAGLASVPDWSFWSRQKSLASAGNRNVITSLPSLQRVEIFTV